MSEYLKRLLRTAAAYQLPEIASKLIALLLLPIYTRHLTRGDYGAAELLLGITIFSSIVVRLGITEAFVRFHFLDEDEDRRLHLARVATGYLLTVTTVCAGLIVIFSEPISRIVLGYPDATLISIAALGLWAFTNLELAYWLLRVRERIRPYLAASLSNVGLTILATVVLVVGLDLGARGLLLGNFAASAVVLIALLWQLRHRIGFFLKPVALGPLLRFGVPTVPADLSVFALNVIDRFYLFRFESPAAAGLYSLGIKVAAATMLIARGFQYAWPPLAYSIKGDREVAESYGYIVTYYLLVCGGVVAALTLLSRWVLKVFAAPAFFSAHRAVPWIALGWMLYGLYFVLTVIAGRANATTRTAPPAFAGLAINLVLLLLLVPRLGIAGAGISLCGSYVAMLGLLHLATRRLLRVDFQWRRMLQLAVVGGSVVVLGDLFLPEEGLIGFALRVAVLLAIPMILFISGFFERRELAVVRVGIGRVRAFAFSHAR